MEVVVTWERVKPILEAKPEVDDHKTDPGRLIGGIKLDRLSFCYDPERQNRYIHHFIN